MTTRSDLPACTPSNKRAISHCKTQGKESTISGLVAAINQCGKRRNSLSWDVLQTGCQSDKYVANALINMYSKRKNMRDAQNVFDNMVERDVISWTTLMLGYMENGESMIALDLFMSMDCEPDTYTYVAVLKAYTGLAAEKHFNRQFCLEKGMAIHEQSLARGLDANIYVATNLVNIYSKCGSMRQARAVFDSMVHRDIVSWNILILGYVEDGQHSLAMGLFMSVDCEPNPATFVAGLKACAGLTESDRQYYLDGIHRQAKERGFDRNIIVATHLVDMYSSCRRMQDAQYVFDNMKQRDVVSWTSLVMGYVENEESLIAMEVFMRMDCEPNSVTFLAVLKACGNVAACAVGMRVHAQICKLGLEQDKMLANCLLDFYGKCGKMAAAEQVFERITVQNTVSWNTLIAGYTSVGNTSQVFGLIKRMYEAGLPMNHITFLHLLTACSHAGMVEEGKKCFAFMSEYGINTTMEHYNCMIDMLGRSNRLPEAFSIFKDMPFEHNNVTWTSLLGSSVSWKRAKLS